MVGFFKETMKFNMTAWRPNGPGAKASGSFLLYRIAPYKVKTLRGDRTAAERNCIAEAICRRWRILQHRILFYRKGEKKWIY